MASTAGTSFTVNGAAGMIDTPHVSAIRVNRQMVADVLQPGSGRSRIRSLETRPRSGLGKVFVRQHDSKTNEDAQEKADDKTKPRGITHRALAQVKNSGRFIFVHRPKSAPVAAACKLREHRKSGASR